MGISKYLGKGYFRISAPCTRDPSLGLGPNPTGPENRHVVTIPSLRNILRAPKLDKKKSPEKGAKLGKKGANLKASRPLEIPMTY